MKRLISKVYENFRVRTEEPGSFKYVGISIETVNDGIKLNQDEYIDSVEAIRVSKERKSR